MHKFRMQLLATAATVSLSGAAWAADMPVKAPPPVAPVPTVANWTGFYVGGQIGGASFDPSCESFNQFYGYISTCNNTSAEASSDPPSSGSLSSASVLGGGRVGADYQWNRVVLGIVGQFDWTHLSSSLNNPQPYYPYSYNATATVGEQIDWLASLRGRVGWAFDNVLFYVTGGVAWTEIKANASFNSGCPPYCYCSGDSFTNQTSSRETGAVVGGGFEYRVTQNVSVVGELLGYHFPDVSVTGINHYGDTYTTVFKNQSILAGTLGVNLRF